MGFYGEQILPRLVDKACGTRSVGRWRARVVEGLGGVVVEPGFGSGSNLPYYPTEVSKVYALDPAVIGRELASDRLAASSVDVEFIGLDGQQIPLEDNSCDAGLLSFTLCTIPEPLVALAELRRVINRGGALHFVEHGLADKEPMQKWQYRIDPVQKRLFGGCHVSRDHGSLLEEAGFEIDWIERDYADGPKAWSFFHIGRAINP
jgi:ubiquinone/menaquinone biosynthesis C-methylase UbiE